jgi:Xaa-Pro aminopeptidase
MQRKNLFRTRFLNSGIDGFLITDLINVRYLSGFTGSSGFIVITNRDAVFVTDFRYEEQAKAEVKDFEIRLQRGEKAGEIRKICKDYGIRRIGFEDHNVSFEFFHKMRRIGIKLKAVSGGVESLRLIKSEEELSCIRSAVRRAESAFRKLKAYIKPGITEIRLALKFEEHLKKEGCKKLPFEVIVASGSRSSLPHATPSNKIVNKGDLIVFDWGGECDGYCSDMTRTVLMKGGRDTAKQEKLYRTVLEAQSRALKAVKAGVKASTVDGAARGYIKEQGYGERFGHGTGHGVGLAVHEKPSVSLKSREIIKEGMVFTIEPGIYLQGFGGVRIEDMIAVGKSGAERLTKLPRRLTVI